MKYAMMPLTTTAEINCADLRPWKRNRGYGDGTPPRTLRLRGMLALLHFTSSLSGIAESLADGTSCRREKDVEEA